MRGSKPPRLSPGRLPDPMLEPFLPMGDDTMTKRLFFALPALFLAVGLFVVSLPAPNESSAPDGPADLGPAIGPPAPESFDPSRQQEGGPDLRREWEVMRLADPATGRIPDDIHSRERKFASGLPARMFSSIVPVKRNGACTT